MAGGQSMVDIGIEVMVLMKVFGWESHALPFDRD